MPSRPPGVNVIGAGRAGNGVGVPPATSTPSHAMASTVVPGLPQPTRQSCTVPATPPALGMGPALTSPGLFVGSETNSVTPDAIGECPVNATSRGGLTPSVV